MVLFRGLNFPFKKSQTEFPAPVTDDELVRQSIIQLMLVAKGERVMRPGVGSNVFSFVFENNDDVLAEMIRSEVIAVIGKHEPRAIIQDVNVLNLRDSQEVQVDVLYVVASSGRQDTITTMIPTNGAI